jgi:hypothetical protein
VEGEAWVVSIKSPQGSFFFEGKKLGYTVLARTYEIKR